jgi:hypothetical protein
LLKPFNALVSSCIAAFYHVGTVAGCLQALEKYNIEKDIAAYIKKEFDKKHTPTWVHGFNCS